MASPSPEGSAPPPAAGPRSGGPAERQPEGLEPAPPLSGETGWVVPALAVLLAGFAYLLARAWERLLPGYAPSSAAVVAVGVLLGLLAFSLAATVALEPAHPPSWWRPVVALGLALGTALLLGVRATHPWPVLHLPQPHLVGSAVLRTAIPAALILLLAVRVAETVGAHLASAVRLPEEYGQGDWSGEVPEIRRVVLETWVLSALALAGTGTGWRWTATLGTLAVGAGGLALIGGSNLHALRRLTVSQGLVWESGDAAVAWRWLGGVSLGVLAIGALVPGLPGLLTGLVPAVFRLLLHLWHTGGPRGVTPAALRHAATPQTPGHGGGALNAAISLGGAGIGLGLYGLITVIRAYLLDGLALLLLGGLAVLLWHWWRLYEGDWRAIGRRLLESLRALLGFWRWIWPTAVPRDGDQRVGSAPRRQGVAARAGAGPGWLQRLGDPRWVVRATYRHMLRRAAAVGYPRAAAQTPAQYAHGLSAVAQGAATETKALTRAYEEARYSLHPVAAEQLPGLRGALQRILAVLARVPRGPGSPAAHPAPASPEGRERR